MWVIIESYSAVSSVNEAGGVDILLLSVSLFQGGAALTTAAAAFSELQEPEISPVEITSTTISEAQSTKETRFIVY